MFPLLFSPQKELDEADDFQLEEAFLKMMAGGRLDHGKNLNNLAQRVERIQPDLRNVRPYIFGFFTLIRT